MGDRPRVLVTGADGLLGSHLVRRLLEGGYEVRALLQPGSDSPTLHGLGIETYEGDILGGADELAGAVEGCPYAFHCAAIANMWADPDLTRRVNFDGARNVFDACLSAGVERLVHIGSASSFSFGPMEAPGDETGPFPGAYRNVPYMESKHRAMKLLFEYVEGKNLDAVVVAPTFLLGDFDFRPSGGELIRQFINRGLKYISPGGRNFAYAGDVARAAVLALEKGRRGEAYIAGGENLCYYDFFTGVARIAGVEPPKRVIPKAAVMAAGAAGSLASRITGKQAVINTRMARFSCYDTYYSSGKAQRELGMEVSGIEVAIEESIGCLRAYGHCE